MIEKTSPHHSIASENIRGNVYTIIDAIDNAAVLISVFHEWRGMLDPKKRRNLNANRVMIMEPF